jgi:CspA family cold shock protein
MFLLAMRSPSKEREMAFGKVKWFDAERGFGFIVAVDGGKDLFAHYSEIQGGGSGLLTSGQAVEFVVKHGAKGLHATEIRPAN